MQPGLMLEDDIPVFRLNTAFVFRGNVLLFNPIELAKAIKDFSPDIVHCHGLLSPLAQIVLMLKRFCDYKVVGDLITGISPLTSILLPRFKSLFNFCIFKNVDAFFACNTAVKKFLEKDLNIPPAKINFIPLGADAELFRPDSRKRTKFRKSLGLKPSDVAVIYTGKFLPSKRIHDLIISFSNVVKHYKNCKLTLVGDGPEGYKRQLKKLISDRKISENVYIFKTVRRTRLPDFYNAADIAVWPGSFSISIIEAIACGLPLIIAKSDWTSHYLENENGYSFRAGDIPKLSSLLLTLVEDDEMRRLMGMRSQKLVESKLSWDVIASKYVEVYRSIMGLC